MKTNQFKLSLFLVSIAILSFFSCGEAPKEIKTINITKSFEMDTIESNVKWKRDLEQGKTKTKMRLFGGMADITIDGFKVTTNGDISLVSGQISSYNDSLTNGDVVFDFTSIRLNKKRKNKGDDLFTSKEFKESKFDIKKIEKDSSVYQLSSELTIAGVTNEVPAIATINFENDSLLSIKSEFVIKTLDWPLRGTENAKSVIKDEITLDMELFFNLMDVQMDTVFVK